MSVNLQSNASVFSANLSSASLCVATFKASSTPFYANLGAKFGVKFGKMANFGVKFNKIANFSANFKRVFAKNSNFSECER